MKSCKKNDFGSCQHAGILRANLAFIKILSVFATEKTLGEFVVTKDVIQILLGLVRYNAIDSIKCVQLNITLEQSLYGLVLLRPFNRRIDMKPNSQVGDVFLCLTQEHDMSRMEKIESSECDACCHCGQNTHAAREVKQKAENKT